MQKKLIIRDLALFEAVCIAIQPIDALPTPILDFDRINGTQRVEVMRDCRLGELQFFGEFGDGETFRLPTEHAD